MDSIDLVQHTSYPEKKLIWRMSQHCEVNLVLLFFVFSRVLVVSLVREAAPDPLALLWVNLSLYWNTCFCLSLIFSHIDVLKFKMSSFDSCTFPFLLRRVLVETMATLVALDLLWVGLFCNLQIHAGYLELFSDTNAKCLWDSVGW